MRVLSCSELELAEATMMSLNLCLQQVHFKFFEDLADEIKGITLDNSISDSAGKIYGVEYFPIQGILVGAIGEISRAYSAACGSMCFSHAKPFRFDGQIFILHAQSSAENHKLHELSTSDIREWKEELQVYVDLENYNDLHSKSHAGNITIDAVKCKRDVSRHAHIGIGTRSDVPQIRSISSSSVGSEASECSKAATTDSDASPANEPHGEIPSPLSTPQVTIPATCGRIRRRSLGVPERNLHPVVASLSGFDDCIKLVRARKLFDLPVPWPRCQDIPKDCFKTPRQDDLVIAISHGWPYQAHPDVLGLKIPQIRKVVDDAIQIHQPLGEVLIFFDFCSVTQRPFLKGQSERSEEETKSFQAALKIMPEVYLLADGTCHVEMEWTEVPGDGEIVVLDAADFENTSFIQLGQYIQVSKPGIDQLQMFDLISKINGVAISGFAGIASVEQELRKARCTNTPFPVEIRRSPMGIPNKVPASKRGWVYLERFVSMIKAAMVEDTEFLRICFSNESQVLDEIRQGGDRLREAAQLGEESLQQTLEHFFDELDQKVFGAASTDAAEGKVTENLGSKSQPTSDSEIVKSVMRKLVRDLPSHWSKVAHMQRQRQLRLAVNRRDAKTVRELLVAHADPNVQDALGCAPLHIVAKSRDADIIHLLIEYGADLTLKDWLGNCPAHCLPLFTNKETVELFEILAPREEVLLLENHAGLRVGKRFSTWASTAQACKPFECAQALVDSLKQRFPTAFERGPYRLTQMRSVEIKPIPEEATTVEVNDVEEIVPTWQSFGSSDVHMVWIPLVAMPWSVSKAAIHAVAQELCNRHQLKIFVLSYTCVPTPETLDQWRCNLLDVIKSLPLNDKFILVDGSIFPCSLAWPLRTRLLAAVSLNLSFVYEEEFLTSKTWNFQRTDYGNRSVLYAEKDVERCFNGTFPHAVYSGVGEEAFHEQASFFKSCLQSETDEYWQHAKAVYPWLASSQATSLLDGFPVLNDVPIWVFCSDNGPAASLYEPMRVFRELYAPHSKVRFIEDSRWWWEAEGNVQHKRVATLLDELLHKLETDPASLMNAPTKKTTHAPVPVHFGGA